MLISCDAIPVSLDSEHELGALVVFNHNSTIMWLSGNALSDVRES